jgi:DNA invertase Pin-like site-specific DNA recombinase
MVATINHNFPMNAAIYIRKSREDKDKPSQRLNVQREQLPAHATQQGWAITIYDDGHASAARGKAENLPERSRLETDIRAGKINIILTIELSRLSRDESMQDYIGLLTLCADHHVKLATISRILDPAQHSDWMLLLMEGGFSSVEMKVLQARMKEGRDEAFRAGKFLGGGCPPPYRYDKAQGRPVIDADLLLKAQRVWKMAETNSARNLAIQLGMPLISTRRMLADDRLLFCQALRIDPITGDTIPCEWEACIDADQAERIRAARRKGHTEPRRHAGGLLSNLGIMICGYCGTTYRGFKGQTRNDGTWTDYYGCRGKETKGRCPKTSMIEQSIIDDRVIINITGTLDKMSELKAAWQSTQDNSTTDIVKHLNSEISTLETKRQRLTAAISEGVIDFADAKQQMAAIKNDLERVQKERISAKQKELHEPQWDLLEEIQEAFSHADQDEQREIIVAAIKAIRVFSTYITIEYLFPRSMDGSTIARVHLPTKDRVYKTQQ